MATIPILKVALLHVRVLMNFMEISLKIMGYLHMVLPVGLIGAAGEQYLTYQVLYMEILLGTMLLMEWAELFLFSITS